MANGYAFGSFALIACMSLSSSAIVCGGLDESSPACCISPLLYQNPWGVSDSGSATSLP